MIELIPAIDIIDGQCVRLSQGEYGSKKVYSSEPLEVAREFEDIGLRRLHLVDLDGAKAGRVQNLDVLEKIAAGTSLVIDFGGGVKNTGTVNDVFNAGASMVTAGSIAVKDPSLVMDWISKFGAERIILGADVRNGRVAIHGWQEDSALGLEEFILGFLEAGVQKVICTDISLDGMLEGPSIELYSHLRDAFPQLEIIASGGVSGPQDLQDLDEIGINGVIFGKAYYEGKLSAEDLVVKLKRN